MKALPNLSLFVAACFTLSAIAADPVSGLLNEARAASLRGDFEAAKAKLQAVKSLDPKNRAASEELEKIRAKESAQGGGTERTVAKLVIPSVQFREAELSAVLDALKQQVSKLSDGKQSVNFVAQLSAEQAKVPITLSLTNVPFTEVLKYVGSLAKVTFSMDKYAIMVRPMAAGDGEPKAAEPPQVKGL